MCDTGHAHDHSQFGFLVDTPEIRVLIEETRRQMADVPDPAERIEALKPAFANTDSVDPARVSEARAKLVAEAQASGKPANIVEKIVDGKMSVFYREEGVLTEQAFAKDDSKSVRQVLAEAGLKSKTFHLWVLGQ